jgi:8-amino-7-oxononanoate synthase|tara:strand:+ start:60250 stop:61422 length:1173 start_codon:yes stop_codon:yes gene_type:complete
MTWHQRLTADLEQAEIDHLRRFRQSSDGPQGPKIQIHGQELTNFCSNDYLGFANHPKIKQAVIDAANKWGVGSGSSHLVCGHQDLTESFEQDFASFVGAESALLFSTGYMANFAVLNSFSDAGSLIMQDKLNHASLIDAGRLSRAIFSRYQHGDMGFLEQQLKKAGDKPVLIATDAVFSMDGDLPPLEQLSGLSDRYGALLYFDDAHGFGVLGNQGRGSLNSAGLAPTGNRLMLATLGKALGSFGAVVAGDKVFIDTLIQLARPYIYTTALPPTVVAASAAGLGLMQEEDWRFSHLRKLIKVFRESVGSLELNLMDSQTAIQPILVGDNQAALDCSKQLRDLGFLVTAIRPPSVPNGTARLRITLSAAHTQADIENLIGALKQLQKDGAL